MLPLLLGWRLRYRVFHGQGLGSMDGRDFNADRLVTPALPVRLEDERRQRFDEEVERRSKRPVGLLQGNVDLSSFKRVFVLISDTSSFISPALLGFISLSPTFPVAVI